MIEVYTKAIKMGRWGGEGESPTYFSRQRAQNDRRTVLALNCYDGVADRDAVVTRLFATRSGAAITQFNGLI